MYLLLILKFSSTCRYCKILWIVSQNKVPGLKRHPSLHLPFSWHFRCWLMCSPRDCLVRNMQILERIWEPLQSRITCCWLNDSWTLIFWRDCLMCSHCISFKGLKRQQFAKWLDHFACISECSIWILAVYFHAWTKVWGGVLTYVCYWCITSSL